MSSQITTIPIHPRSRFEVVQMIIGNSKDAQPPKAKGTAGVTRRARLRKALDLNVIISEMTVKGVALGWTAKAAAELFSLTPENIEELKAIIDASEIHDIYGAVSDLLEAIEAAEKDGYTIPTDVKHHDFKTGEPWKIPDENEDIKFHSAQMTAEIVLVMDKVETILQSAIVEDHKAAVATLQYIKDSCEAVLGFVREEKA